MDACNTCSLGPGDSCSSGLDSCIIRIFSERCYDENEDDPWQYLTCVSQDALPPELKPKRVVTGKWILVNVPANCWRFLVSIDPCYSLLPKTQEKQDEQRIAAMGKKKWQSKGSARKGMNPRAPATAKTQVSMALRVDWTPIFARGRLKIHVVDPKPTDPRQPCKLADSENLEKFITNVLPNALDDMKMKYGWSNTPRTVVHDKASYFVTTQHERLHVTFASALQKARLRSWVGDSHASTAWLAKKLGDIYLHETVISHIRRLLDSDFACARLNETPAQFKLRMQKVEDYMNSPAFKAPKDGRGLAGLAQELHDRCRLMVKSGGERVPK